MRQPRERLALLRGQVREWAADVLPYAAELESDPGTVRRMLDLPLLSGVATLQIPPEYAPAPLVVGRERFDLRTALERVVFFEEGARADAGLLLSVPGPDMAGSLVDALGDRAQKDWFYGRLLERPTWTCFAMTESERGSDATSMATSLTPSAEGGSLLLRGGKRFVGNAVRAGIAVVFARMSPGPLGIRAVLVDTAAPGFAAEPIPTMGLRAIQLGAVTLDAVQVPEEHLLGRHLPAIRQGMWGWLRTFHVWRTVLAAMGVGIAAAAHAYARRERRTPSPRVREQLDAMDQRIRSARQLTHRAARTVDADPSDGTLACAAKLAASRLADRTTREALALLGPGARLDHPALDKMARDAQGLEFMEGTSNMQRLSVFNGVMRGGGQSHADAAEPAQRPAGT
ncbi:acyl-CoA dehydrogenase family protein [Streptomyces sp. NPDC015171]|uniref:acyl-CoA dehydrogenase family protein n=1 Tax=Streptomyces sp. NPDC015171 TaxID=3364945 RepID=UPI0036F6D133